MLSYPMKKPWTETKAAPGVKTLSRFDRGTF